MRLYPLRDNSVTGVGPNPTGIVWQNRTTVTGLPAAWGNNAQNTKMVWCKSSTSLTIDVSVFRLGGVGSVTYQAYWYNQATNTFTGDGTHVCATTAPDGITTLTEDCSSANRDALYIRLLTYVGAGTRATVQARGNRTQIGYNAGSLIPAQKHP